LYSSVENEGLKVEIRKADIGTGAGEFNLKKRMAP
jgi:hypothetical protein